MRLKTLIVSTAIASAGALLAPSTADACGGFFCSQSAPVVQTAERILFMQLDDNTIETHVQISYTGPSEDFAWIVPTPSSPTLSLGSDQIFSALDGIGPPIRREFRTVGTCRQSTPTDAASDAGPVQDVESDISEDAGGGVVVVALETVGPFDTAILQATAVEPMMQWLDANGYDLPPATAALLSPYIMGDMHFLALKLTKNATAGDLQPIAMTYTASAPMIPIQLTAIAAADEMPIQTWIVADQYARPSSYVEVEPEHFRVAASGWFSAAGDALDSVREHGMVRSYADVASRVSSGFSTVRVEESIELLRSQSAVASVFEILTSGSLEADLRSASLRLSALSYCAPMPQRLVDEGVTPANFYAWPGRPGQLREGEWQTPGGEACADWLEERIFEPRRRVSGYFDTLATASRFDTWLRPEDMTLDPVFCYDADARSRAEILIEDTRICREDLYSFEAPVTRRIGDTTLYPSRRGGSVVSGNFPRASRVTRYTCDGPPEIVRETSEQEYADAESDAVVDFNRWFDHVPEEDVVEDTGTSDAGTGPEVEPTTDAEGSGDDGASPEEDTTAPDSNTDDETDAPEDQGQRFTGGTCTASGAAVAWPMLGVLLTLGIRRRRR
ncbi:MAG: hypothetical protein ACI81R_003022 [Bradymonadia bacterium]|jgi:hypothetical protein